MDDGLWVNLKFYNKDMECVDEKDFSIKEYFDSRSKSISSLISIFEDMCYEIEGGKSKSEWSGKTMDNFKRTKHKILNISGEISRVPENLYYNTIGDKKQMGLEGFLRGVFSQK